MKLFVPLLLVMTATTLAQPIPELPRTVQLKNPDGTILGTTTSWGNRIVLRRADGTPDGVLVGTLVFENGTTNFYSPNGVLIIEGNSAAVAAVRERLSKSR
jgi:hypothetical protein